MASGFRVVKRGTGYTLATWNDHVLSHWYGRISAEGLVGIESLVRLQARKHASRKCGDLILLDPYLALPDDAARTAVINTGRAVEGLVHGIGVVVLGEGFVASAIRAFATSVGMVARGYGIRSFSSSADAGRYLGALVEKAGDTWGNPGELDVALGELRAEAK